MLSPTSVYRLTTLIRFMESVVPTKHFKMNDHWVAHRKTSFVKNKHGLHSGVEVKPTHLVKCGMAACALGWAAVVPEFKKQGLGLQFKRDALWPVYEGEEGYEAAEGFFGIDPDAAQDLFGSRRLNTPRTPRLWAKRAVQFLRDNGVAV